MSDETSCPVFEARGQLERVMAGSEGRDVFAREGTRQVHAILTDLSSGKGDGSDLELVEELCSLVAQVSSCPLASTAATDILDSLGTRRAEWDQHLLRKRCPAQVCPMPVTSATAPREHTGMTRRRRRRGEPA